MIFLYNASLKNLQRDDQLIDLKSMNVTSMLPDFTFKKIIKLLGFYVNVLPLCQKKS